MAKTVTITLSDELRTALDELTQEEGVSADEMIGNAIREYLFFRRFRSLRERMTAKAKKQGIHTDQDVFDRVS